MSETATIIRKLRDAGYTQAEISRGAGIPQYRLSRWESGLIPIGADYALRLAEFARATREPSVCGKAKLKTSRRVANG